MYRAWIKGLFYSYWQRLAGGAGGIAIAVTLAAMLGVFLINSASTMTVRAIEELPVDWQIQLSQAADPSAVLRAVEKAVAARAALEVDYAKVAGFQSTTGQSVQTTGTGVVVGLARGYQEVFPREVRLLTGRSEDVLLAQQTAANLHVQIGDSVEIKRYGLRPVALKVAGIVDMPYADSFFQLVGLAAGGAPHAPPDNVMLVPQTVWRKLFPASTPYAGDVHRQLHVKLAGPFEPDPAVAGRRVMYAANNVEAALAGSGIVGNNLAARLNGVRADADYAKVLFLFLGLPGMAAAVMLAMAVIDAGALRRRKEQALLRIRGAAPSRILGLAKMEFLLMAVAGVATGILAAWEISLLLYPNGGSAAAVIWPWLTAGVVGLFLAVIAGVLPAWQNSRKMSSSTARAEIGPDLVPWWQNIYLDLFCLLGAVLVFWQSSASGYQLVLAPEGVPQTAINYLAFLAPFLLWLGGLLFITRCFDTMFFRGRNILTALFRPLAGNLAYLAAAALMRQRRRVVGAIALASLAVAFAVSTAIFNTTYQAQTLVDAELTNGADVAVFGNQAAPPGDHLGTLRGLSGVTVARAIQHRYAYVGRDLQDIYGIEPLKFGEVTHLSDAYFYGTGAGQMMRALAADPKGILVSAETARDYQLHPGDSIRIRLQSGIDHQYHVVPFHFIGIVKEFPTAPKDSFLVANASYIARKTGLYGREIVLLKTDTDPSRVAALVRGTVGNLPGMAVSDITQAQKTAGSSLTAINLKGLSTLELAFAILVIAGVTGLVFALQTAERRRFFAILSALGASSAQIGGFLWIEGLTILIGSCTAGFLLGIALAWMLVKLMTGVFDPPPETLAIPVSYLLAVVISATVAMVSAVFLTKAFVRRNAVSFLREI